MKNRGRKSADALATVVVDVARQMPMRAPAELSDAQAAVWRDAAAVMPGDWLTRGAAPLLTEFCRHVCRARHLEAMIRGFETEWTRVDGGLERLDKLHSMADRETKAIAACARALRLSPQAQMHARTAARRTAGPDADAVRPWDE